MKTNSFDIVITSKEHLLLNKALFKLKTLPVMLLYSIIVIILSVICFLFNHIFVGVFLLLVMILYNLFVVIMHRKNVKNAFEKSEVLKSNIYYHYTFNEDIIDVTLNSKVTKYVEQIEYKNVYRVIEDKNNFYIFVNKYKAFVFVKDNATIEQVKELKIFLKSKIKNYRYI